MRPTSTIPSHSSRHLAEGLTIRMAVAADAAALRRLAELDSAPPPEPTPTLIGELGGVLCAALPLGGGRAIADPFRRTAEVVAMLTERARLLDASTRQRSARRWRPRRAPAPGAGALRNA